MFTRKIKAMIATGLILFALLVSGGCGGSSDSSKTEIYYNAKVFTADKDNPSATAFAVRDGKFVYVGRRFGVCA